MRSPGRKGIPLIARGQRHMERWTPQEIAKMRELVDGGLRATRVAERFGLPVSTLYSMLKRAKEAEKNA